MDFLIYKKPTGVSLIGLLGLAVYFAAAVLFFRGNEYYYLILGGGVWGLVMLFIKSIGSMFISAFTVTSDSIETVTSFGGIIKINFSNLDWERTQLTEAGLFLVPISGESIALLAVEISRQDILRLAHHIGLTDTGWYQEL